MIAGISIRAFRIKHVRSFGLLSGVMVAIIFMFFLLTPTTKPVKRKKMNSYSMLTQSPEHLKKQQEYEKRMLANIEKMAAHKKVRQRMNKDPMGVILHKRPPSLFDGLDSVRDIESRQEIVNNNKFKDSDDPLKRRIVHLDLKGAPPKVSYLKSLFPFLNMLGATGLLIEYEDMFPYWGKLEPISARNAYARGDIADILESAKKNDLEVIPLVQTFGHMEFVLKLKEFQDLREVPNYPQVICPTNNKSEPLIMAMIDQIMELHPGINWLHIGSDEDYNIGECQLCQSVILNKQWSRSDFFLNHAKAIAKYVKNAYDVQPIMWDDEFHKVPLKAIQNSEIGQYVEIMVWKYSPGILVELRNELWERYHDAFNGVWVASAFKGASSPDSYITNISDRLNNHKEWMEVVDMYKSTISFKGIALTGWQRFDHFAVLSELLPQALPSLAINLMYVMKHKADHNALTSVGNALKCDSFLNLDIKYIDFVNKCNFPGSKIYEIAQRLYLLKRDIDAMTQNDVFIGWVNDYNIEHNFGSPQRLEQGLQDLSMLLFEFRKLMSDAEIALKEVYDEHTVQEWISLNLKKTLRMLENLETSSNLMLKKKTWPQRPLKLNKEGEL